MSSYLERTKQRYEAARLIRAMTSNLDVENGRGAYRVPVKVANRLEEIVGQDFSATMQDSGFYRDATRNPNRKPGVWKTGGRTRHGGESVRDWVPSDRFWPVLRGVVQHFAPA